MDTIAIMECIIDNEYTAEELVTLYDIPTDEAIFIADKITDISMIKAYESDIDTNAIKRLENQILDTLNDVI